MQATLPSSATSTGSLLRRRVDRRVLIGLASHALVVALALAFAGWVAVPVVAVAMVWCSNTVSHLHLHTPLFVSAAGNRMLSGYLTMVLGVPQTLWRDRHLRHHARYADRVPRCERESVVIEVLAIGLTMALLAVLGVLLPWLAGTALGYVLCSLQGRMEHVAGVQAGWSTYGRWHNRLWFNDGYHAEHHRFPGAHWSELPARRLPDAYTSPRTPFGRALELRPLVLGWLERVALRLRFVRAAVLLAHVRATARVLDGVAVRRALIVGGGLYPRTALVLSRLRPEAALVVLDADADHLEVAHAVLAAHGIEDRVELRAGFWLGERDDDACDLVTLPLALRGDRFARGAGARLVHAWVWERPRGNRSAVVAWWLLKRVVLIPGRRESAS